MEEVVIVSAARTPIGKFGGSLKNTTAIELGAIVVKEVIKKSGLSADKIDQLIFGNVLQAGLGQNPARQIAVHAGVPYSAPSMTVNEVCGSGLKAVILGSQAIQLGDAEIVVVGGTENMTQAPYLLNNHRWGKKAGNDQLIDSTMHDGLTDAFDHLPMGMTAENVAVQYNISRTEQDAFAAHSQMKAAQAQDNGAFSAEIVPVPVKGPKGQTALFSEDEFIRKQTNLDSLAKLPAAFKENGTVTAGNSSGINDGAAALILMKKSHAEELNISYLATLKGYAEAGINPSIMGYAPYYAIEEVLEKTHLNLEDMDLIELNEAFAAQSVAVMRDLNMNKDKVNVNGGAIALGHPIGASGARILVSLVHEMQKRETTFGLASLCVGGGIGMAMVIEKSETNNELKPFC
ncbi:acetyl-CoA C-acetyltransferase [Carnobacterium mobile]|uniref:acetyl-CoA C-acetyltransferase n=1 Tax=Carnobacterium mobile TaxID=2750 RepID=UPI0018673503|nr:acetyl-CoA C-acetyltransferase [Carnobacterium mobile]